MKTAKNSKIIIQVGVKALIFNKTGKVLIIKRNAEKYPEVNNLWDIPGGRIDSSVSLEDNLKREILEEIGFNDIEILALIAAQDIIKHDKHVVRLTYVARETKQGKPRLSEEHTEFKWVTLSGLGKLKGLDSHVNKILKDITKISFIKDIIPPSERRHERQVKRSLS